MMLDRLGPVDSIVMQSYYIVHTKMYTNEIYPLYGTVKKDYL